MLKSALLIRLDCELEIKFLRKIDSLNERKRATSRVTYFIISNYLNFSKMA